MFMIPRRSAVLPFTQVCQYFLMLGFPIYMAAAINDVLTFPLMNEHSLHHRTLLESTSTEKSLIRGATTSRMPGTPPQLAPVFQDSGAYYVDIYLGSPPQRQTVLLDTGSQYIAIPCTGCKDCGNKHTDKHFEQSQSMTLRQIPCSLCLDSGSCVVDNNTCEISTSYLEGSSWKGTEVQDYVYAGGPHHKSLQSKSLRSLGGVSETTSESVDKYGFPLSFFCMTSNKGEFKTQKADGIMGMNARKDSFWRQMYDQGAIQSQQFSMCVRKFPYVPIGPKVPFVGAMTLGGVDSRLNSSPMAYMHTDINNQMNLFSVQIRKILVQPSGGLRLGGNAPDIDLSPHGSTIVVTDDMHLLNKKEVFVDSGSTDTALPKELKPVLDQVWKQIMGNPFPTTMVQITAEELKTWPTIIFQMKGSSMINPVPPQRHDKNHPNDVFVAFPPSSYMRLNAIGNTYEPGLHMDQKDIGLSILGSNFMRGHNVHFDIDNERIGMAESNCDYKLLVTGKAENEFMDPYPSSEEIERSLHRNITRHLYSTNKVLFLGLVMLHGLSFVSGILGIFLLMNLGKTRNYYFLIIATRKKKVTTD